MQKQYLLAIALIILPFSLLANTPEYCKPNFNDGSDKYFVASLDKANDALSGICNALANNGVTQKELNDTLENFHQEIQKEAVKVMPQLSDYLNIFDNPLIEAVGDVVTGMVPDYIVVRPDDMNPNVVDEITFYYQGKEKLKKVDVPKAEAQSCMNEDECSEALIAYMDILKGVYNPLAAKPLKLSLEFLTLKDKEWMTYIDEARGQTFVDIAITSFLYEKRYGRSEHDFRSPPNIQWFALRPNVLIENVSAALDGDQLKESLALELIGFNYWKDACFGYACGSSLIVSYSDRNGVEDVGWGVMLHFENSYSFGVTTHDGDAGYFITVDLLKLFQDKKSSFDDYKKKYRSLSN